MASAPAIATSVRRWAGDASGAVADLGILVPIVAALVLKNGLDAGTVLVGLGGLYVVAGWWFRVPVPVQPVKAAAAIALARHLPPATIAAAAVLLGAALAVLGTTGGAALVSRVFARPVVRGLQFGVGLILVRTAWLLGEPASGGGLWIGAVVIAVVVWLSGRRHEPWPAALAIVLGGAAVALLRDGSGISLQPDLWRPAIESDAFSRATLWSALTLLVIPQIPLTLGNAVVALNDVEHRYFGRRARRVTPARVSLECGLANMVSGAIGGIPMCHGSGGLTAHYRAGARTARMNMIIGTPLLLLGLLLAPAALDVLALVPITVLVGLLALNGVTHALLVRDLSGYELAVAVAMGVVGLVTANLAWALALGLALYWPVRAVRAAAGSAGRTA